MPLPPPPAAGLTSSGKPTRVGRGDQRRRRTGPGRRSRRGPGRRATPPAGGPRPCRPSPGSPPAAARPSGSRPRHRLGEVGVLGQEPEARVDARRRRRHARPRRPRRCRAGRARPGRPCRGHDRPDPEPVARPRDPRRDLAAVGDEQGADRARWAPAARRRRAVRCRRTRQSRHSRHANVPQRVWRAADRSRSSAGRSASSPRSARQPGLDSVPRTSMSRSSHIRRRRRAVSRLVADRDPAPRPGGASR